MKKTAIIGGIIALGLLILLVIFCSWIGKKLTDKIREESPTIERKETPKPNKTPYIGKIENAQEAKKVYLAFGNPSGAIQNPLNRNNYLLVNNSYVLSYNNNKGTANWAAWRITKSDIGSVKRRNNFRPDSRLPNGFKRIKPYDYSRSGYDRGHLCPSGDRTSSPQANSDTFLMTNMIPQTASSNRHAWESLESYSRRLVKRTNLDLYVVAGVYGEKGKVKGKVSIPRSVWKVVIAVPKGEGISAVNDKSLTIAVDIPNENSLPDTDWRKYRTTIRNIERKTGYNFLSVLPQDLQDKLENRLDRK